MGNLEIYVLSVGQGDTAVVKTPQGNVIVIDAVYPNKLKPLLKDIKPGGATEISHLVVTHPHDDHYTAVPALLQLVEQGQLTIRRATFAPFWHGETGTPQYHTIINRFHDSATGTSVRFLSGYERTFPDGGLDLTAHGDEPCLELVGPSNDILDELHRNQKLNTNHVSVMARLRYGAFSMVFAADAQMENWGHYDREGLLSEQCSVLKAAHHGSIRGTQYERLERLMPEYVIVSSDPAISHHLPDLVGSAVFKEYERTQGKTVLLTRDSGTVRIEVTNPLTDTYSVSAYGESRTEKVSDGSETTALTTTDWADMVKTMAGH